MSKEDREKKKKDLSEKMMDCFRWEFLRRSENYQKDYYSKLPYEAMIKKYHIGEVLPPDLSAFDKYYNPTFRLIENPFMIKVLDKEAVNQYDKEILPIGFFSPRNKIKPDRTRHMLLLAIPLDNHLEYLVSDFELIIKTTQEEYFKYIRKRLPNGNKKPRWEEFKLYLRVYDLKHEKNTKEVANLLFKDDNTAERNVANYHTKANKLIKNAEKGDFPGRY